MTAPVDRRIARRSPGLVAVLVMLLACSPCTRAFAASIQNLEVDHSGGRYSVTMRVLLEAPAERAYAVFADPRNLSAINPGVQEVRVGLDGELFTRVRVCAGVFCKTMRQVQTMRYSPRSNGGRIAATVVPDGSDLRSGSAQWDFAALGARTELQFVAALEPDFWIPPFIGPWLVENSMRQEAERTCAGIERLANERLANEHSANQPP